MKKKIICIVLLLALSACLLFACNAKAEKTFVKGEEILFADGEPFELPASSYIRGEGTTIETFTITSAQMVAEEEFTLDNPEAWLYPEQYLFSYRYRIYVTGYAPIAHAGEVFHYTLRFRTVPYNGVEYLPTKNYKSETVKEDGYFEFSVDVYMPDIIEKVQPTRLTNDFVWTQL